jgi:uncharacterized glyoxalase superfamily protein PhnB
MAETIGTATIIPSMMYQDAPAAIEWLCKAFGFEKKLVVPGEAGKIAHSELTFGNGMVMIGSASGEGYGKFIKPPNKIGGAVTQSACVLVADADAHYARAKAAGARIVMEIEDKPYGGRGYSCLDLEGHLWYFGTYDPWTGGLVSKAAGNLGRK